MHFLRLTKSLQLKTGAYKLENGKKLIVSNGPFKVKMLLNGMQLGINDQKNGQSSLTCIRFLLKVKPNWSLVLSLGALYVYKK